MLETIFLPAPMHLMYQLHYTTTRALSSNGSLISITGKIWAVDDFNSLNFHKISEWLYSSSSLVEFSVEI